MKKTVSVTYTPRIMNVSTQHRHPGFTVFADAEELGKWKNGNIFPLIFGSITFLDHGAVPLAMVLDRMAVYITRGATKTGLHETASKQVLDTYFEAQNLDDIFCNILENGDVKEEDHI